MNPTKLLAYAKKAGIRLWRENGKLRYHVLKGSLSPHARKVLQEHRDALLEALRPLVICSVCGWRDRPGGWGETSGLPICQECYEAGRHHVGAPTCQMFCTRPLAHIRRADPGGLLCCHDCWRKLERARGREATEDGRSASMTPAHVSQKAISLTPVVDPCSEDDERSWS
jgi:hypothetical protein